MNFRPAIVFVNEFRLQLTNYYFTVSSYEVRYSSRIETILEGDFAVVDEFTECSPVAPGNTQTCRFNISNFTEITAFFSVAAAVETEKVTLILTVMETLSRIYH